MPKILAIALFVVSIACTKNPDPVPAAPPPPPVPATDAGNMPRIVIDPADRVCTKDADCAIVATQCSCSCGEGVKKDRVSFYQDRLAPMCVNYGGKTCKMDCRVQAKCVDGACSAVATSP